MEAGRLGRDLWGGRGDLLRPPSQPSAPLPANARGPRARGQGARGREQARSGLGGGSRPWRGPARPGGSPSAPGTQLESLGQSRAAELQVEGTVSPRPRLQGLAASLARPLAPHQCLGLEAGAGTDSAGKFSLSPYFLPAVGTARLLGRTLTHSSHRSCHNSLDSSEPRIFSSSGLSLQFSLPSPIPEAELERVAPTKAFGTLLDGRGAVLSSWLQAGHLPPLRK